MMRDLDEMGVIWNKVKVLAPQRMFSLLQLLLEHLNSQTALIKKHQKSDEVTSGKDRNLTVVIRPDICGNLIL